MDHITFNSKTHIDFDFSKVDKSWHDIIGLGLSRMDYNYLCSLSSNKQWIPGKEYIFNAFNQPLRNVRYILLGESPYPRKESANGYAFWDARVSNIWSNNGLSKEINKATSLRNMIKMLLVADQKLAPNATTQENIASISKTSYVKTLSQLFDNFHQKGFLLLNASLVLTSNKVKDDSKQWRPFIATIINKIVKYNPTVKLILFGKISEQILAMELTPVDKIIAEHPYNHTFITNKKVIGFFESLNLLTF